MKQIPWHPDARPTVERQPPRQPEPTLDRIAPLHPASGYRQIGPERPAGTPIDDSQPPVMRR